MSRRRFTERDVLRTLIHQGVEIRDYRTGEKITLENVASVEREHLHEVELGGPDEPANCRYSLKASHDVVTHGKGATTAGSSIGRISKTKRIERTGKMAVNKLPPGAPRPKEASRAWGSRKLQSGRKLPARGSRPMNRKRRA